MKRQKYQSGMSRSCDENGGELGWNSDSEGGGSEEVEVSNILGSKVIDNSSNDEDEKKILVTGDDRGKGKATENRFPQNIRRCLDIFWPTPKRLRSVLIETEEVMREDLEIMLMLAIRPKLLEILSTESSMNLEDFLGPFSSSLKAIREQNRKRDAQQLIEWKPLKQQNSMIRTPIPSLLDLSLRALAKNSEDIVSLGHVPDWLRQRFTNMLCDAKKMNSHILNLLLRDSPTELRVKDCSWITGAQTRIMFGKLDTKNLKVLQLDLSRQYTIEYILCESVIKTPDRLMCLRVVSLRGACYLTDDLLKALVTLAPFLQSVNVGQSSLLTWKGIKFLADSLAPSLRELYIDDCPKIDAIYIAKPLSKIQHLEVLSVAENESVSDAFVTYIAATIGRNVKELDLENCRGLTDHSLRAIGMNCLELQSINISDLSSFTDLALLYLANGCRSVRKLRCRDNWFSDDAIAAFLEVSGETLKELSLDGVEKVGPVTALSLAKYSRNLTSLDLSWCRRISDEALGLIVDRSSSLKLLKIFGCEQITEIFLKWHSNRVVQIVEDDDLLEQPEGVVLRYSPISE